MEVKKVGYKVVIRMDEEEAKWFRVLLDIYRNNLKNPPVMLLDIVRQLKEVT